MLVELVNHEHGNTQELTEMHENEEDQNEGV
jgi:hypothetical protein